MRLPEGNGQTSQIRDFIWKKSGAAFLFYSILDISFFFPHFSFLKRILTKAQEAVNIQDDWRDRKNQALLLVAPD